MSRPKKYFWLVSCFSLNLYAVIDTRCPEEVIIMRKDFIKNAGIQLLLDKYKKIFRISENVQYYSKKDYEVAEKKFIKYALSKGKV